MQRPFETASHQKAHTAGNCSASFDKDSNSPSLGMRLRVLGCSGSRLPGKRLSSYLLDDSLLLDAGAPCGVLELEEQKRISDVLITHAHLDHVKDLPFLADNLFATIAAGERGPITVHAPEPVLADIKTHIFNNIVWPDFTILPSAGSPVIEFNAISCGETAQIGPFNVRPFSVDHHSSAVGYAVWGDNPQDHFVYTGDTGVKGWIEGMKSLPIPARNILVEVSFPDEMEDLAHASGHLTPKLLAEALTDYTEQVSLYISHVKNHYGDRIQSQLNAHFSNSAVSILSENDIVLFSTQDFQRT
jgi:ribonuclease BN (tRNA processing enzyme)